MFLSDNGPWNAKNVSGKRYSGSQGKFLGLWQSLYTPYNQTGKFTTWEGGMRVPGIAYWPGKIQPGISREIVSLMDILPTLANLAETALPAHVILDGFDLSPVLFGTGNSRHKSYFYYRAAPPPGGDHHGFQIIQFMAIRHEEMKLHYMTMAGEGEEKRPQFHDPPLIFNLTADPAEEFNLSAIAYSSIIEQF